MENFVLIIHLIVTFCLVGVVLMQRSEGGGLGMGGSSASFGGLMSIRGKANLLTRATAILAACFFATSLILAIMASHPQKSKSLLDQMPVEQELPVTPVPPVSQ